MQHQQQFEETNENTWKKNSADIRVSEEGMGEGAAGTKAEIALQLVVKTTERQAVHLQPTEVNNGADIRLQSTEHHTPEQEAVIL